MPLPAVRTEKLAFLRETKREREREREREGSE
jgi:hypothetical protein